MARYERMVTKQTEIMYERGKDRDNESPIYFRRSPEMNLGVAQSKVYRIEALLTQMSVHSPAPALLKKIVEECLDASNYLLFIAVLCSIVLDEEQVEEKEAAIRYAADLVLWKKMGYTDEDIKNNFGNEEQA